jgi:hypothetical protein
LASALVEEVALELEGPDERDAEVRRDRLGVR